MGRAYDVAVLGAGPAGLAAAYRAAASGRSVVVLEQSDHVGGLAGSFDVDGVRVDHGSHRLHPSCPPEILGVLRRLLGDDLQLRQRNGRIRLAGRWVAFPPRAADLVRQLPLGFVVGMARDAATAPWRRPRADTFAEVLQAGLGPTMARSFYFPYVRKIWGTEPEHLSGELARRRVGARGPGALVRRVVRPEPGRGVFYYPRRGYGAISEVLRDAALDAGAEVRLGAEVTGLQVPPTDDGPHPATIDLANVASVAAAWVFSTLPLALLARLVRPAPPDAVRTAAADLTYRALVLVYLTLDRARYTPFDAHYFPGPDVVCSRLSEPKNYRDGAGVDPPDHTVLCAEVPCSVGDAVWCTPDDALGARVVDDLASAGLPRARPVNVTVRRVPRAYPCYRVGYETAFTTLDGWASRLGPVVTLGRQGLFAHDNTHHAMAMGWAAADAVGADGRFDRAAWAAARARFAAHVVED